MKITKEQIQIFKNNNCDIEYILKYIEEDDQDNVLTQQFIDNVMPPTTRFGADGKNHSLILRIKIFKELQEITDYKIRTYFSEETLRTNGENLNSEIQESKDESEENKNTKDIKENRLF